MRKSNADIVGNKLRIRGALHQRLVQAAERKGVSLNSEMASRLQASFDQESDERKIEEKVEEKVGEKIHHLEALFAGTGALTANARLGTSAPVVTQTLSGRPIQGGVAHQLQAKLIVAAEALIATIEQMPVLERAAIDAAIEPVKRAIAAIDQNALAELRRANRSES
jgi:hypothetical protein